MFHAAIICHGSCACRTRDNLVPDSQILSSRHSTYSVPDRFSVQLWLYTNAQPWGLLNAPASLLAVCQELECLLSASWGLSRQPVGWGVSVSVLPLFSTFFFFFFPLLHSLITSSCAGSCLRNTGSFWGFWQRGVWKRLKSGLGNVYPSKIWLREFLWASTLLL